MVKKFFLLILLSTVLSYFIFSQNVDVTKQRIANLTSEKYFGRGYMNNGVNKAAEYLAEEFLKIGIKSFSGTSFFQNYMFDINIFPKDAVVKIDGQQIKLGEDFIIDADSPSFNGSYELFHIDSVTQNDISKFYKLLKSENLKDKFLVIDQSLFKKTTDFFDFLMVVEKNHKMLAGVLVLTSEELLVRLSHKQNKFPSITVRKDAFFLHAKKISINIKAKLIKKFPTKNVIGYVEGEIKDTFFVFAAHYDHVGGIGKTVFVPGAQDNAGGAAFVLDLADYFSKHKTKYSVAFMLFSGEEAGLLGSSFYTENPLFDLNKIKFLFNLDLVGTGDEGFTLVNGDVQNIKKAKINTYETKLNNIEKFEKAKDLILQINEENNYFPSEKIKLRGHAANSDHYPFFCKGIPCFFIYTMGGKTYYHNPKDKLETLTFAGYNQLFKILTEFTEKYE